MESHLILNGMNHCQMWMKTEKQQHEQWTLSSDGETLSTNLIYQHSYVTSVDNHFSCINYEILQTAKQVIGSLNVWPLPRLYAKTCGQQAASIFKSGIVICIRFTRFYRHKPLHDAIC